MPLAYQPPPSGRLQQGELIGPLWDHQPVSPPTALEEGAALDYRSICHSLMMVMSNDCDLLWDFDARFSEGDPRDKYGPENAGIDEHGACLSHVLVCDAFTLEEIRPRFTGKGDIWRRIKQNQDERYHKFEAGTLAGPAEESNHEKDVPDLYLDFKRSLGLPTRQLYEGLRVDGIPRLAIVPPIFLHDALHRYYGYLSRIAVPVQSP